ncbi:RNA-protein complex protein Nop10 [Candidatus Woesearchaeota archaeon]|nr:RNA-protein complex protein Nop10 [Candidatus Woesearchaeota archaeon]
MVDKLHYCSGCQQYTMHDKCPKCGTETHIPKPPKFSLVDKYGAYRREVKKKKLIEKGLY